MIDVVLSGRLALDPAREEAFRALPLEPEKFTWPGAPLFNGESEGHHPTVGALFDAMAAAFAAAPESASFFEREGDRFAGLLAPEHTALFHQDLATALRAAGDLGGEGNAVFFVPDERVALEVPIGKDAQDPAWGAFESMLEDPVVAADFLDATKWKHEKNRNASLARAEWTATARRFGLGDLDANHRALLDALRAVGPARLYEVVAVLKTPRGEPLAKALPDAATLEKAIASEEPLVRVVGIELLARTAPEKAEPILATLWEDASSFVREAAISALGSIPTAAAADRLFGAFSDRERGPWAVEPALAIRAPDFDERLLGALDTAEPFTNAAWAKLERGTVARQDAGGFAARVLFVLAKRGEKRAIPRLFALWSEHAAEEVRKEAARALALLGGPEVEARQQDLMFTLMDMGKALNQDDERRREILALKEEDSGGIIRFDSLDADRLETLAREGFINMEGNQNESPSASQFFGLMRDFPGITARGYAVSHQRADYRVTLDGVAVDLDRIAKGKRDELRALFEEIGASASERELEGKSLSLWWT